MRAPRSDRWSRIVAAATALGGAPGHAEQAPAAGRCRVEVTLDMPNVRGAVQM